MARLSARIQLPAIGIGLLLVVLALLNAFAHATWPAVPDVGLIPGWVGVVLVVIGLVANACGPAASGPELELDPPVSGRWVAVNSPTTKVPSHGTFAMGQTFALDLVYDPDGAWPPVYPRWRGGFLPPEAFAAFGRPVFAPATGVVVVAFDRARDHRSRTSWLAVGYFVAESFFRVLGGAAGVCGNHVVVRLADGSHVMMAHLRRGSLHVHVGQEVRAGQQLAECGNSGNSTQPHLHLQRQDIARIACAAGLPWTLPAGIPPTGSYLVTSDGR